MKVTISSGNSKIGKITNISLTPLLACNHDCDCKKGDCYALKAWRMYPNCRKAWNENMELFNRDWADYFRQILTWLKAHKNVRYFRWHVAGDVVDQNYISGMIQIADRLPRVQFLAFTKMHNLDFSAVPSNLKIIFSMWPNWGDTEKKMPRAWMQDGTETRIPAGAIECSGECDECLACWNLSGDVVFAKH